MLNMGNIISKNSKVMDESEYTESCDATRHGNIANKMAKVDDVIENNDNVESMIDKTEQHTFMKSKESNEQFGNTLINMMKSGVDEFKNDTGRQMTYAEMREAFG